MYLHHYGLKDRPFQLAHNPAYYYPRAHQVPLNELCYSIEERQGLATLIGEAGTGKTTILKRLLQCFGSELKGVLLSDASLGGHSIVRQLESSLGIFTTGNGHGSGALARHLAESSAKTVVVLIDEAQALSSEQLEEVRFLTNLEGPKRKLLEIIIAGQPSLSSMLNAKTCVALNQRVAVRCHLEPLDLEHTQAYIQHRLYVAQFSRNAPIFTNESVKAIHENTRGIPRLINILCERCLVIGYVENTQFIAANQVQEAVMDLKMGQDEAHDPQVSQTANDALITRLGTRMEAIDGKLDALVQMLTRAGFIRPELAGAGHVRRWVEDLQGSSPELSIEPNRPEDLHSSKPETTLRIEPLRKIHA